MATSLMRAPTRYKKIQFRVNLANGINVDLEAYSVEVDVSGTLILRDGDYAVQMVFAPAAWLGVNRR